MRRIIWAVPRTESVIPPPSQLIRIPVADIVTAQLFPFLVARTTITLEPFRPSFFHKVPLPEAPAQAPTPLRPLQGRAQPDESFPSSREMLPLTVIPPLVPLKGATQPVEADRPPRLTYFLPAPVIAAETPLRVLQGVTQPPVEEFPAPKLTFTLPPPPVVAETPLRLLQGHSQDIETLAPSHLIQLAQSAVPIPLLRGMMQDIEAPSQPKVTQFLPITQELVPIPLRVLHGEPLDPVERLAVSLLIVALTPTAAPPPPPIPKPTYATEPVAIEQVLKGSRLLGQDLAAFIPSPGPTPLRLLQGREPADYIDLRTAPFQNFQLLVFVPPPITDRLLTCVGCGT